MNKFLVDLFSQPLLMAINRGLLKLQGYQKIKDRLPTKEAYQVNTI